MITAAEARSRINTDPESFEKVIRMIEILIEMAIHAKKVMCYYALDADVYAHMPQIVKALEDAGFEVEKKTDYLLIKW